MSVVYGPNTVKHILKDAAYSKALREHFLADAALVKHVMSANSTSLDETLEELQEITRTAKLWVFYHQLVRRVQEFILAERLHDWQGHLNAVAKMLGIFAAAGHGQYAKFGWFYLQEMLRLPGQYPEVSVIKCYYLAVTILMLFLFQVHKAKIKWWLNKRKDAQ